MRRALVTTCIVVTLVLIGPVTCAQTYDPRPVPKAAGAMKASDDPQLLPQAGLEVGTQKTTITVQALRLHVKGHPEIKFNLLSAVPATTETQHAGTTPTSQPSDHLQRSLTDAAGGIANINVARQFDLTIPNSFGSFSADFHGGVKLVEVPDVTSNATGTPTSTGDITVRPVPSASAKLEWRLQLENEDNTDAGVFFANWTAVYNHLQDDVALRFNTPLQTHNFSMTVSSGFDLPNFHVYIAGIASLYTNDGQFGHRYAITFNPHR
jgi:hypothetical protein